MDYRDTLQLPRTAFAMKANLPDREPSRLKAWETFGLYEQQRAERSGRPKFILHDGPPYANGDIHTGTALNKILKDMITRYWNLVGYDAVYVPGWDTHGLPIEMRALKKLGVSKHQIEPIPLRQESERVARHYIGVMTEEFRRLGVMGDWEHPYVTMDPSYEAAELRVVADLVDKGLIYRDLRPVYWCPHCETALAEGEIEYRTHRSPAIYVAFAIKPGSGLSENTRAVIWTTTPWTIPANLAIAVNPDLLYRVVDTEKGPLLIADALVDQVLATLGLTSQGDLLKLPGKSLAGIVARHPYLGHDVPLILGEHVTEESGTGLVHTAPGHGVEDFEVGRRYHLDVVQPIDNQGRFVEGTPLVAGLFNDAANPVIIEKLKEVGALLHVDDYDHQYAYCWRCKNPVIFRATKQWFLSIDQIREQMLSATDTVRWDPLWGKDRMRGMIRDRGDWCLSRQRVWGVPIPAFYCEGCQASILQGDLVRRVADMIAEEGSASWWQYPSEHFLPQGYQCAHCEGTVFRQENDVLDVWMDSGSSQAAVLAQRSDLAWPCDLVLEGNDQYRGWFQSLLTTGVATRGQAPYKMVLTHGMVLDKSGQEMHKSLGNTIDPMDIVKQYGSDVLRLWVATSDFRGDVRISDEILRQLAESYRKIRNTFRFLLGNLKDFIPDQYPRSGAVLDPLNRWAIDRLNGWLDEARTAYADYHFHTMVHGLIRLMTIDLSSFYLDVIKDRLYTLAPDNPLRRETQAVLYDLLVSLTIAISPVLVFTADEIWEHTPRAQGDRPSVHLMGWPNRWEVGVTERERQDMQRLSAFRDVILKAIEPLRAQKVVGNSLEAAVTLRLPEHEKPLTAAQRAQLTEMCLVASIDVQPGEDAVTAEAQATSWSRCERCWRYDAGVHDELCDRCRAVLQEMSL